MLSYPPFLSTQDSDGTLRASEKSVLLTTLSTWPHLAVHRVLRSQAVRVPHLAVAGACGRVAVAEAAYKPLAAYLDQPPAVRKGLGEFGVLHSCMHAAAGNCNSNSHFHGNTSSSSNSNTKGSSNSRNSSNNSNSNSNSNSSSNSSSTAL